MKRPALILLGLLYLMAIPGISVCFHYCGESLEYVSLFGDDESKCCCKEETEPECCDNTVITIAKIGTEQILPKQQVSVTDPSITGLISETVTTNNTSHGFILTKLPLWGSTAPPDLTDQPLYIFHSSLLI